MTNAEQIVAHGLKTFNTADFRNPCLRNFWRGYRAACLAVLGRAESAEYSNLVDAATKDSNSLNEFIGKVGCRPKCVWDEKGEEAV